MHFFPFDYVDKKNRITKCKQNIANNVYTHLPNKKLSHSTFETRLWLKCALEYRLGYLHLIILIVATQQIKLTRGEGCVQKCVKVYILTDSNIARARQ
jgi:hypothetical protein